VVEGPHSRVGVRVTCTKCRDWGKGRRIGPQTDCFHSCFLNMWEIYKYMCCHAHLMRRNPSILKTHLRCYICQQLFYYSMVPKSIEFSSTSSDCVHAHLWELSVQGQQQARLQLWWSEGKECRRRIRLWQGWTAVDQNLGTPTSIKLASKRCFLLFLTHVIICCVSTQPQRPFYRRASQSRCKLW
jgi:hypothetical protein